MRPITPLVACALAITGCANLPKPKLPYENLNVTSYGSLSQNRIRYCDSESHIQDDTIGGTDTLSQSIAHGITGAIFEKIGGAMTVDPKIIDEELQDQFKLPGDTGMANVIILDRNKNGIVFWFLADVVHAEEVSSAAEKYCRRHSAGQARFVGLSQTCPGQQSFPIYMNGKQFSVKPTYVISAYSCSGGTPSHRRSRHRNTDE